MGFLDKAKAAAEQAASKAKEGVQDVQTKRELSQAYHELGQKTHELFTSGALSHPDLTALLEKISALKEMALRVKPVIVATGKAITTIIKPFHQSVGRNKRSSAIKACFNHTN